MMRTYKEIIGGTIEDAEKRFPWLKKATFSDATINITAFLLTWDGGTWKGGTWEGGIWDGGTWKGGTWEYGIWKDGTWEDGTWEYGIWEDGTWKKGLMWDNLSQEHLEVMRKNGKFKKIGDEK